MAKIIKLLLSGREGMIGYVQVLISKVKDLIKREKHQDNPPCSMHLNSESLGSESARLGLTAGF